jgi:hypothetical protein
MPRFFATALAIASLAFSAQSASAQSMVFLSAGVTFPSGDYAGIAEDGWMGHGGVAFPIGTAGFSLGVDGFYGVNKHDGEGDQTNLYGGGAFVLYDLPASGSLQPYVFGGPSYMVRKYKSTAFPEVSNSGLAAQIGAGLSVPAGQLTTYLEGTYTTALSEDIDGTDWVTVSIGIDLPLGG